MGLFDYKNDFGLLNEQYTEYSDRYKSQIRSYDMRLRMNIDVDLTSSTQMQFGIVGVLNETKRPDASVSTIFENLYKMCIRDSACPRAHDDSSCLPWWVRLYSTVPSLL